MEKVHLTIKCKVMINRNKAAIIVFVLISACESTSQTKMKSEDISRTEELIGDLKLDSVVIKKSKIDTAGDYVKLATLSDSYRLTKIKKSLNRAEGRMMKFIPDYRITIYCSDSTITLGYAKPNKIISFGSSLVIDSEIEKIINKLE